MQLSIVKKSPRIETRILIIPIQYGSKSQNKIHKMFENPSNVSKLSLYQTFRSMRFTHAREILKNFQKRSLGVFFEGESGTS